MHSRPRDRDREWDMTYPGRRTNTRVWRENKAMSHHSRGTGSRKVESLRQHPYLRSYEGSQATMLNPGGLLLQK